MDKIILKAKQLRNTIKYRKKHISRIFPRSSYTGEKIRIKVPIPGDADPDRWGDYHFALCLARALNHAGKYVYIDTIPHWYDNREPSAVIVLRGLAKYYPRSCDKNILWIISHPSTVSDEEMGLFHKVFAAGRKRNSERLQQCTSTVLFSPATGSRNPRPLFVGNARGYSRQIVKDMLLADVPFDIIGDGWEGTPAEHALLSRYVPYNELPSLYRQRVVILNDQHEDMAEAGFVCNRVYDALASNSMVITTPIMSPLPPKVYSYSSIVELTALCQRASWLAGAYERDMEGSFLPANSTFEDRARVLIDAISKV